MVHFLQNSVLYLVSGEMFSIALNFRGHFSFIFLFHKQFKTFVNHHE